MSTFQTISVGTVANDRTGDPLRTAYQKANSNFVKVEPVYGAYYVYAEDEAQQNIVAAVAETYYSITGMSNGEVKGAPYLTLGDDVFTVGESGAGLYRIEFSMSLEADKAAVLHADVTKNGAHLGTISSDIKLTNQNDQRAMAGAGMVALVTGDTIGLHIKSNTTSTTIGLRHVSFTIQRISA